MKTNKENIQDVINGCKQEVPNQQALFVHTFSGLLFSVCKRYLKNEAEAKDALQESFMRILKNISSFDPKKGKIESWITTITIRHCLKQLQKKRLHIVEIENSYDEQLNYYPEMMDNLSVQELMQMIHRLPNIYKEVFNLFEIDGFSHQEIGKMVKIEPSTSRSRLMRAKLLLRQEILKIKNQESWIETI